MSGRKILISLQNKEKENIMSKNHHSIISIRVAPEGNATREESSSIQPPSKNDENISRLQPTPDIVLDEAFSSGSSRNTSDSGLGPILDDCRKYAIKWINDTLKFKCEQQASVCSGLYFLVIVFPLYEETDNEINIMRVRCEIKDKN